MKDVARRHTASWSEDGARGRLCKPFPGGFGHQPAGTMTGTRGASLQPGPAPAGAPRRVSAPRRGKPGPTLSLRDEQSLGQEPRWNAGRRARPQTRCADCVHLSAWPRAASSDAEVTEQRLSAFHFPFVFLSSLRGAKAKFVARSPGLSATKPGGSKKPSCPSRISRSLSSGRPLRAGPVGSIRATDRNDEGVPAFRSCAAMIATWPVPPPVRSGKIKSGARILHGVASLGRKNAPRERRCLPRALFFHLSPLNSGVPEFSR